MKTLIPFFTLFVLFTAVSCSNKDSSIATDKTFLTRPSILEKLSPLDNGTTFYFFPFRETQSPNVFLEQGSSSKTQWKWGAPKTVSGFHWPWEMSSVLYGPGQGDKAELLTDQSLPVFKLNFGQTLAYEVDTSSTNRNRWPAVVGLFGNGNLEGGVITGLSFMGLTPLNLSEPLRVFVLNNDGVEVKVVSKLGKSCGTGCVDVTGFQKFLDVPLSFGKPDSGASKVTDLQVMTEDPPTDFKNRPIRIIFPQKTRPKYIDAALAKGNLTEPLGRIFRRLNQSVLDLPHGFDFHTIFKKTCSYQGLEHPDSTILSFGTECNESSFSKSDFPTFVNLAAHELLHVWNGKWIYPKETAQLNLAAFDSARNNQLYFFEGFTEGLARLLMSAEWPTEDTRNHLVAQWNKTAAQVQNVIGQSLTFEEHSRANVSLGYELGAWLALEHALQARILHGFTSMDAEKRNTLLNETLEVLKSLVPTSPQVAQERRQYWNMFKVLAQIFDRKGGYQSTDIATALTMNAKTFNSDPLQLNNSLLSNRMTSSTEFETRFRSMASALSRKVEVTSGLLQFGDILPESVNDQNSWYPF